MDINTQINTYFATAADATNPGEGVPNTTRGNTITPYIDGRRYFRAIRSLLTTMGSGPNVSKQFFYAAGWWFQFTTGSSSAIETTTAPPTSPTTRSTSSGSAFRLNDDTNPDPGPLMAKLLAERAADGVDVRVLPWVNPSLLMKSVAEQAGGFWNVVTHNLLSIKHLREFPVGGAKPLEDRVMALSMAHAVGAMHLKMVIAHDGTKPWAFVGGIDFQPGRADKEMHIGAGASTFSWHDMMVGIDGPAIQPIYSMFQNLWNEQRKRPTNFLIAGSSVKGVTSGTSEVPPRILPSVGSGKHRVGVATTLPQYNFTTFSRRFLPHNSSPLTFATNGRFEIKVALKKAIENASDYIYIEDQAFWSHDVMKWIRLSVKDNPNLKVILLKGAPDPIDPPIDWPMVEAINNHLLTGLTAAEKARIGFFIKKFVFVHSKVTIIDDHWLLIGTANIMRRGLFTEIEMSIATLDEDDKLAKETRVNLWGAHFGKPPAQRAALEPLNQALSVWNPAWGSSPPFTLPSALIEARPLPLPAIPFNTGQYRFQDADSRETF